MRTVLPDGFEPSASTMSGWRALQTAPREQENQQSGWRDLNPRSPAPQAGGLAGLSYILKRRQQGTNVPRSPDRVGTAGFEPAFSCFRGTRPLQTGPRPEENLI